LGGHDEKSKNDHPVRQIISGGNKMVYQLAFSLDSPVGRIYTAIKKSGVSDDALDQGFDAVVSSHADMFKLMGKRDKIHQAEEVLIFALHNYLKFQRDLESNGYPVIWSFDDLDPTTTFDNELREKVMRAINAFKAVIQKTGLGEKDPLFQEKLALSVYYFTLTSADGSPIRGTQKELTDAGLEEVALYLKKNGGLGIAGSANGCGVTAPALTSLKNKCSRCVEDSAVLFALFKMAGLNATFIDSLPTPATAKRYGYPAGARHVAVVLLMPNRNRIFDPGIKNSNAEEQYKKDFVWHKIITPLHFLADFFNNVSVDYSNKGDVALAFENTRTSVNIFPYNVNRLFNLAEYYRQKKDYDNVIKYLEKGLALQSDHPTAREMLSSAYLKKGQIDKAISQYEWLLKTNPKNPDYLRQLIYLFEKADNLPKVIEAATLLINLLPKDETGLLSLAEAHRNMKDYPKAEPFYLEVIKVNPKQVVALHNFGTILFNKSVNLLNNKKVAEGVIQLKKAKTYFEQALQANPNSKGSAEMLEQTIKILKEVDPEK
jgi:tetratricopeptide (TPR) repeat protein